MEILKVKKCWFDINCPYKKDNSGNETCADELECSIYKRMYISLKESEIPQNLWHKIDLITPERDKETYEQLEIIQRRIIEFVEGGNNLILEGLPGNGKTTWALKLMMTYFSAMREIPFRSDSHKRGIFVQTKLLFYQIKQFENNSLPYTFNDLINADLVIWDDFLTNRLTNYEYDYLFSIIDARYLKQKANIFTTNTTEDEAKKILGDKLFSRIYSNDSSRLSFLGKDMRNGGVNNG